MADIFDLEDIKDIPESIRCGLKQNNGGTFCDKVLKLFELADKPRLSIEELTVGYYRKFGGNIKKVDMRNRLYQLSCRPTPPIEKVKGCRCLYRARKIKA